MYQETIQECPECRGLHRGQYAHCEECWAFLAVPLSLGRAPGVLPSSPGALTQCPSWGVPESVAPTELRRCVLKTGHSGRHFSKGEYNGWPEGEYNGVPWCECHR